VGTRCADHVTPLYPQKLALTSPTGGGRSVDIVRVRTKATESRQYYPPYHPVGGGEKNSPFYAAFRPLQCRLLLILRELNKVPRTSEKSCFYTLSSAVLELYELVACNSRWGVQIVVLPNVTSLHELKSLSNFAFLNPLRMKLLTVFWVQN